MNTAAGKIVLNVKRGLGCRVTVRKFLGSVHTQGGFHLVEPQVYETPAYATARTPTLTIDVDTPIADIALNEVS